MKIMLSLPKIEWAKDSIFVMVDRFFKMVHFITFHKTNDTTKITFLFFNKVVQLHGVSKSITFDQDTKFLGHF